MVSSDFSSLTSLQRLSIHHNSIAGQFNPDYLPSSILIFLASNNYFDGNLDLQFFNKFPDLSWFDFSTNSLDGVSKVSQYS